MNKDNCIICYEKISEDENVKIKCGHTYCLNCFIKHMRIDNKCAICRKILCEKDNSNKKKMPIEEIMGEITELIDECDIDNKESLHVDICNFGMTLGQSITNWYDNIN